MAIPPFAKGRGPDAIGGKESPMVLLYHRRFSGAGALRWEE
jgi:hypothetical protein